MSMPGHGADLLAVDLGTQSLRLVAYDKSADAVVFGSDLLDELSGGEE